METDSETRCASGCWNTGLGYSLILPTLYRIAGSLPAIAPSIALATVAAAVYLGYMVGPLVIGPVSNLTSLLLALAGVGILFLAVPVLARMGESSAGARTLAPAYAPATTAQSGSKDQ